MEEYSIFSISYDLTKPNQNYEGLYEGIKSFGTWWHQTGSVWFIRSDKDSSSIRDYLKQFIDDDDKLFVIKVFRNWAGTGFTQEEYDWLHKNLV